MTENRKHLETSSSQEQNSDSWKNRDIQNIEEIFSYKQMKTRISKVSQDRKGWVKQDNSQYENLGSSLGRIIINK